MQLGKPFKDGEDNDERDLLGGGGYAGTPLSLSVEETSFLL